MCDPIDGSPSGFPVPGILRQEHWSGVLLPSPSLPLHPLKSKSLECSVTPPSLPSPPQAQSIHLTGPFLLGQCEAHSCSTSSVGCTLPADFFPAWPHGPCPLLQDSLNCHHLPVFHSILKLQHLPCLLSPLVLHFSPECMLPCDVLLLNFCIVCLLSNSVYHYCPILVQSTMFHHLDRSSSSSASLCPSLSILNLAARGCF